MVVLDTPEVQPGGWGSAHLSFLYGPLDIFLDSFLRTEKLLDVEPSNTVGIAGCIPVLVSTSKPSHASHGDSDDFALARALDPACQAASARSHDKRGSPPRVPWGRARSAVPAKAPLRPRGSGLEFCLEQANSKLWQHLVHQVSQGTYAGSALRGLVL